MRLFKFQEITLAFGLFGALAFLACADTPAASAQVVTAAVHGTVTDASGAVVPNAKVTALNTATGISTTTASNANGYYIFPELQVGGPYTITISAPGFQNTVTSGLMLNVNDNREVPSKLAIGTEAQTVTVAATAIQVETSDTQLKQTVDAAQLEQVPLEGRDPAGLQKLEPGTVESSDRLGGLPSNGNQSTQNSYVLNGTDINDGPLQDEGIQINPDALAEEDIVTSTLNPEVSRNSGAVLSQVLKSGTNSFHGSGFEFYRDTFMNNGDYFSQIRPVFHQNLFGGTLGGPVFRNKLFFFLAYQGYRNRTGETTLAQTLSPSQLSGDFSSDSNYATGAANSSGLTTNPIPFNIGSCIADPAAATPETWADCFPGGTVSITPAQWNSIASTLISKFVPGYNFVSNGTYYYNFNEADTKAADQGIIKVDYTPTSRDHIWAMNVFQSSPSTDGLSFGGGSFPGFAQVNTEHFKLFGVSWTHSLTSNTLNELRGGYYRLNYPSVIPQTITPPSAYGFSITPQLAQSSMPYLSIGNYFDLGFSYEGPQPRLDTNTTYADNFTWVLHNHTLKFGFQFEQFRVKNPFGYLNNGYYDFGGGGTYSSGDPIIDFVMGIPDDYEQTSDGLINALSSERFAYVQDNYKVTPDLTLNYGIAWDAEQPTQNKQFGGLGIVCFSVTSATSKVYPGGAPGLFYPGDPGCNEAGGPTTHDDHFGPRVGFAWSPSGGPSALIGNPGAHDFSVRAGFGVYFDRDQEEQSLQNLTDPPSLFTSFGAGDLGLSPGFANPFSDVAGGGSEADPFPYSLPKPGSTLNWALYQENDLAAFDSRYDVPYTYNFNVNIERTLPASMILQIGYVGSQGRRLATWYEGDPITPAGHAACMADPACSADRNYIHRDYPQYTAQPALGPSGVPWYLSVGEQNTEGVSNYNSLQASVIKSATHGLQFSIAYTYSHALDNGSGYESVTGGVNDSGYGNYGHTYNYVPGYGYLNYGDSDFDARQRLIASYVYRIPTVGFLRNSFVLREALSGWGIGGITALQTGFPIGISTGLDRSLWCDSQSFFGCGDVPNTSSFHVPLKNPRSAGNPWFDTSSFSLEPVGTFGNVKRNFFHGPGFNYTNLQLSKTFAVNSDGSRYIELRLEAYNAFNHANFAQPGGILSSGNFGQITGVIHSADPNADPSPGRAAQLVGKFYF